MNNDINQPQGNQPTGGVGLPPLPPIPEMPMPPALLPTPEPVPMTSAEPLTEVSTGLPTIEPIAPPPVIPADAGYSPLYGGIHSNRFPTESPKPKNKINKKLVFGGTLVLLLLGGAIALAAQFGLFRGDIRQMARYTEVGVGMANVTDNSISVWWLQKQKARGCVTLTNTETQQKHNKCDEESSFTHLVNVTGLSPATGYQVEVKHGETSVYLSPFWGRAIWTRVIGSRKDAEVVKGRGLDQKGEPVVEAVVFVAPGISDRMYIPLAVTTNQRGEFSVDLAILKMQFVDISSSLFVEVTSKDGLKLVEKTTARSSATTLPDILVDSQ